MKNFTIYIVSFLCGGVLIASELTGSRFMAPYFGVSVYVWTSVLICTLAGLSAGYFIGGKFSEKSYRFLLPFIVVFLSILTYTMPLVAAKTGGWFLSMKLVAGSFLMAFTLLFPLFILFGMISPVIIGEIRKRSKEDRMISGWVFFISSIGGVFFTLITGWYLIPEKGLKQTTFYLSMVLLMALLFSLLFIFTREKNGN